MKTINPCLRSLILLGLAGSTGLGAIQMAHASTQQSPQNTNGETPTSVVDLLGEPQHIQLIQSDDNVSARELPTFKLEKKSKDSRGILGVLSGQFIDEDRHPSFRDSTLPDE